VDSDWDHHDEDDEDEDGDGKGEEERQDIQREVVHEDLEGEGRGALR